MIRAEARIRTTRGWIWPLATRFSYPLPMITIRSLLRAPYDNVFSVYAHGDDRIDPADDSLSGPPLPENVHQRCRRSLDDRCGNRSETAERYPAVRRWKYSATPKEITGSRYWSVLAPLHRKWLAYFQRV